MNRRRTIAILATILIAQLLLIALTRRATGRDSERPIFAKALESNALERIVLGGTKHLPATLTLAKQGDVWVIADAQGYPADGARISELLRQLTAAKASRPISVDRSYHAAMGVDDEGAQSRLRLFSPGKDEPFLDLVFGASSEVRSASIRHSGDDAVWQVYGLASWDIRPDAAPWLARPFIDIAPDEVTGISVETSVSAFQLQLENGAWMLRSRGRAEKANAVKVAELITTIATISPTKPAGRTEGALPGNAKPLISLRILSKSGGETMLHLAGEPEGPMVEVAASSSPFAASVWRSSLEPILAASEAAFRSK